MFSLSAFWLNCRSTALEVYKMSKGFYVLNWDKPEGLIRKSSKNNLVVQGRDHRLFSAYNRLLNTAGIKVFVFDSVPCMLA